MEHKTRKVWKYVLILAVAVAACMGCWLFPYLGARSSMPVGGVLTVKERNDGRFLLSWPSSERADFYRVEILDSGEVLWQEQTASRNGILLPEFPEEEEYTSVDITEKQLKSIIEFFENYKLELDDSD